jgi:hypothetical protein
MGIFSKEPDYSEVLMSTFMTVSQAIKAGEDLGMYRDGNVDASEFWALYLWHLGPYADKRHVQDPLEPAAIEVLVYSNASVESIEEAQNTVFNKSGNDLEVLRISAKEIQSELEARFLNLDSMDNEAFTRDCIGLMTESYKSKFNTTYTNQTSVLVYILTLALRSILIDTLAINITERNHRRKFGFFLTSIMLVNWNYKSKLS